MTKILKIDENDVVIGLDDGELKHVKKEELTFTPKPDMPVKIYESNGETIIVQELTISNKTSSTLLLVAFILNILVTVGVGWLLLPLAWMIPMTVASWHVYKGFRPNTIALGVCTLIFLNPISGILMLVSNAQDL